MRRMMQTVKWLLRPGGAVTAVLTAGSAILLTAVFMNGWEESTLAYIAYPLSAWALSAAVMWAMETGALLKRRVYDSAAGRLLKDEELRRSLSMYAGLSVSLLYALFKLVGGWFYRSAWLSAVAIYYIVLAVVRYLLLQYEKKGRMNEQIIFELTGALIVLLGLTMTGIAVQMVRDGKAYSYPGYMIYASAAYTFYSLTAAVIQLIRRRKESGAVRHAARMISCAVALMALYALQTGLLERFGTAEGELFRWGMNIITGAVVCCSTMGMGVYMLVRGQKKKKE